MGTSPNPTAVIDINQFWRAVMQAREGVAEQWGGYFMSQIGGVYTTTGKVKEIYPKIAAVIARTDWKDERAITTVSTLVKDLMEAIISRDDEIDGINAFLDPYLKDASPFHYSKGSVGGVLYGLMLTMGMKYKEVGSATTPAYQYKEAFRQSLGALLQRQCGLSMNGPATTSNARLGQLYGDAIAPFHESGKLIIEPRFNPAENLPLMTSLIASAHRAPAEGAALPNRSPVAAAILRSVIAEIQPYVDIDKWIEFFVTQKPCVFK